MQHLPEKNLSQLRSELGQMQLDIAISRKRDHVITEFSQMIGKVTQETQELYSDTMARFLSIDKSILSVEKRLIAIESRLDRKDNFDNEIILTTCNHSFQARLLAIGSIILCAGSLLFTLLFTRY